MNNLFLYFTAIMLTGCSTVPITGRRQLSLVSDSQILALSEQSYSQYMSSAKKSSDKAKTDMVACCGRKLQKSVESYFISQGRSSELSNYNWSFELVKDDTPNAFCLPGGRIVVYEGILPYTETEDGLAVVLGHEIAHAVAKHSNERISQQYLLQAGGSVIDILMDTKSTASQAIVSQIYGLGSNVGVMLPFSRKQEYEADELGLIFMSMAGYNPDKALTFWTNMSKKGGSSTPEFLSTHPADSNRIEAIGNILPGVKSKYYKK